MINFVNDNDLGKVVNLNKLTVTCFGNKPITDLNYIKFAAGEYKFSNLFGFKFESIANIPYKTFCIMYVCKGTKGGKVVKTNSQVTVGTNFSRWFIGKIISSKEIDIIDSQTLLGFYGFDIQKFFNSDFFNSEMTRIKSILDKTLTVDMLQFAKNYDDSQQHDEFDDIFDDSMTKQVKKYIKIIQNSLQIVDLHAVNQRFIKLKEL